MAASRRPGTISHQAVETHSLRSVAIGVSISCVIVQVGELIVVSIP